MNTNFATWFANLLFYLENLESLYTAQTLSCLEVMPHPLSKTITAGFPRVSSNSWKTETESKTLLQIQINKEYARGVIFKRQRKIIFGDKSYAVVEPTIRISIVLSFFLAVAERALSISSASAYATKNKQQISSYE